MSADGIGTVLDLSSVASLDAGFNDSSSQTRIHTIAATNGGKIDLSGLETVSAPARGEDRLDIVVNTGGQLDLSSFQTVTGAGTTRFALSDTTLSLPAVQSVNRVVFDLDYQSTIEMGNGGTVALGDASRVAIEVGGLTAGNGYSQVNVTGDVALAGTLDIAIANAFEPQYGQIFEVLTFDSLSSRFTQVSDGVLAPDRALGQFYDSVVPDALALLVTAPGDANGDLIVNISDFGLLAGNFNQPGTWESGDFNGDGVTNINDFGLLAANFNGDFNALTAAAAELGITIPEPGTLAVVLIVSGIMSTRRWRR